MCYSITEVIVMDFKQFISISDLINNFSDAEKIIYEYGEIIIISENKPKYVLMGIEKYNSVSKEREENEMEENKQDLINTLNKIGKSTFVDYYYVFKNDDDPISNLPQEFTLNSRRSRTSKARSIFRDNLNLEALQIIISSNRLDLEIIEKAKQIYKNEKE